MKLKSLIEKIGFSKHLSKDVDDVAADKFEDFGITVGQLYQTFLKKDLSADPAIAQKIMDMVDTDDDNALTNQIKDLEFLVNQLPDKPEPKGKIGFEEVTWRPKGENPDKGAESKTNKIKLGKLIPESFQPIKTPIDLIDSDILNIPVGSVGEIKRAAAKLGIDPQNKYESELRDEIDDLLTSRMSTYEEYELVKKYFGDYADELIHDAGLKINEKSRRRRRFRKNTQDDIDDRSEKDKEFDLAQKLSRLTPEDREKLKKIQQLIANQKEKNEEKIRGFDYHYTHGTSGGTQQFGRPRIVNEGDVYRDLYGLSGLSKADVSTIVPEPKDKEDKKNNKQQPSGVKVKYDLHPGEIDVNESENVENWTVNLQYIDKEIPLIDALPKLKILSPSSVGEADFPDVEAPDVDVPEISPPEVDLEEKIKNFIKKEIQTLKIN